MTAIYLIRHGQASFGKADYDQLSDKGIKQAQLLGNYWQFMPVPNKIYSGNLLRHQQTLKHFLLAYPSNMPAASLHKGFNELDHLDLLACYDAKWKDFAKMTSNLAQQATGDHQLKKIFFCALERWISQQHNSDYKETWCQFKQRCVGALQDVINITLADKQLSETNQQAQNICIFTSAGTISVIVQHILGISDEKVLALNLNLRNTSVTKLVFSGNNVNIDYFNNYSHLTTASGDWLTFR